MVRVVGSQLATSYHPDEAHATVTASQVATLSVWGEVAQQQLVRTRIGIVGLGSVGSLVAEALSRMGLRRLTYIDFDKLEVRNLDRTVGSTAADAEAGILKVQLAARNAVHSSTATDLDLRPLAESVLSPAGLAAALDCDVLVSCVDRPWPRHLLNVLAYSHLIPVVDGGTTARVKPDGTPQHVAWRIHTVGPGRACLVCLGQLRRSDVALDREGKLDDPDYIEGLSEAEKAAISGRNVFPFSMSVAAHEVLQLVGLATGSSRIGGIGPQTYDGYPGAMKVQATTPCSEGCEYAALTATAADLTPNLEGRALGAGQLAEGVVERFGRQVHVEPREGVAQPPLQHDGTVVGAPGVEHARTKPVIVTRGVNGDHSHREWSKVQPSTCARVDGGRCSPERIGESPRRAGRTAGLSGQ